MERIIKLGERNNIDVAKLINKVFTNTDVFKAKIKEVFAHSKYKFGSDSFARQVIGLHWAKILTNQEYAIIKSAIIRIAGDFSQPRKKLTDEEMSEMIHEAKQGFAIDEINSGDREEEKRAGIHPEDYKIK
jgi:hypothetical protein